MGAKSFYVNINDKDHLSITLTFSKLKNEVWDTDSHLEAQGDSKPKTIAKWSGNLSKSQWKVVKGFYV